MWLRQLLSIAMLPFTVAVLVPLWIARRCSVEPSLGSGAPGWVLQVAGLGLLALGLVFFTASLRKFATEGHGTLAPWDPPLDLMVRGPYRYVRNPMISGVVLVLFGESLALLSVAHAGWVAVDRALLNKAFQLAPDSLPRSRRAGILAAGGSVPELAVRAVWCT